MKNEVLRRLRRMSDETHQHLADAIGVSRLTIINIETGKTKRPADEIMVKIAEHYQVPVETIFFTPLVKHVVEVVKHEKLEAAKARKKVKHTAIS